MKLWENEAKRLLNQSLSVIPLELNELDWKQDISSNNKRLSQHLSAYANYPGGGTLVFGIDNAGNVIGVSDNSVAKIIEKLANLARDSVNPVVRIDHSITAYKEIPILFVYIGESSVKPVHLRGKSIEESYIRTGGTTRLASRHEIASLMLNSKTLRYEELNASKLLESADVLELLDYKAIYGLLGKPVSLDPDEILNWMETERMIKQVNGSGYYITNFGAIAAAKDISDFDGLSRKATRIIKYKGLNKVETESESIGKRGYATTFKSLILNIKSKLPQSEIIKDALRKETTVYPDIALRELVANALIHQDFTVMGAGPMIEVYDDRISITSIGSLLPSKKVDRLIGTSPESRNEVLASSFRRYGICEERGAGFQRAITAIELYGLPPLSFEEGENYFRVVMFSPKTFADMSIDERVQACYQHATIRYYSNGVMTNASLRERFKMPEKQRPMISKLIKDACDRGAIKPKNPDAIKFAEYIPSWA